MYVDFNLIYLKNCSLGITLQSLDNIEIENLEKIQNFEMNNIYQCKYRLKMRVYES